MADVSSFLDTEFRMSICILIPVYNESRTIGSLVAAIKKKNFPVIVINDGSTDNSGLLAGDQGASVITHLKKMGKGYSLKRGFEYVLEEGYDAVVVMDGDGQHSIDDLDVFLTAAKIHPLALLVGNRMENARQMPKVRLLTNKVMSSFISLVCGQKIPDTQCGYRYIPRDILQNLQLKSNDFEIESEILTQVCRKGYKVVSVPIQTIYQGETSHINPFKDTLRFLNYFFKEIFQKS